MSGDLLLDLHPSFQPVALIWRDRAPRICKARITETWRSPARQEQISAAGASRLKIGFHNFGLAFDFAVLEESGLYVSNGEDPRYRQLGEFGEQLGMAWGGRWAHPDWDHLEFCGGFTVAEFEAWLSAHPVPS